MSIVIASLALGLFARESHADAPPKVSFAWVRAEGAESCPDGDTIARAVTERLGRDPFGTPADQHIEAVVSRYSGVWSVHVYVREPSGAMVSSREIAGDAPDCEPITAATVVALAVAIDPESAFRSAPSSSPPPASSSPPPGGPSPAPERRTAPPIESHPDRYAFSASLRAYGALGALPALAPGVGLAIDPWAAGRVRVTLAGLFLGEQSTSSPRVGIGLTTGSAGVCVDAVSTRRLALAGCGSVWLGAMYAVVYQLLPHEPGPRPWVAASLGARFSVRLFGPLSAEIALDVLVPITDYRFFVEGSSVTIFDAPPVVALGSAGLGVRFW